MTDPLITPTCDEAVLALSEIPASVVVAMSKRLGAVEPFNDLSDADIAAMFRDGLAAYRATAPAPASGGVREALLLVRPVIAGLIEAQYNVETWGLKGRLAKIDTALSADCVCEVCGGDCSAANPPPSYCPERDTSPAALSSLASSSPAEEAQS